MKEKDFPMFAKTGRKNLERIKTRFFLSCLKSTKFKKVLLLNAGPVVATRQIFFFLFERSTFLNYPVARVNGPN